MGGTADGREVLCRGGSSGHSQPQEKLEGAEARLGPDLQRRRPLGQER